MILSRLQIGFRIHFTTVVALLGLLTLAGLQTYTSVRTLEQDREALVQHVVESAAAVAAHFNDEVKDGRLTLAQAQGHAVEAIRAVRYRGQEYVFITDTQAHMVMHPFKPELEGQDVSAMADPNGFHLFAAFAEIVRARQSGFVAYLWPRPGSEQPVEKLSFVMGFAPWGWVIGSGLYIADLRAAQRTAIWHAALAALSAGLAVALLATLTARGIVRPLRRVTHAAVAVMTGQHQGAVPETGRGDEVGILARALQEFRSGQARTAQLEAAEAGNALARQRRHQAMERHTEDFAASVSGGMGSMLSVAATMRETARVVVASSVETRRAVIHGSEGATASTESLSSVASATEELATSVQEIARQVTQAGRSAEAAVASAGAAESTIRGLSRAAGEIDDIVAAITKIAQQTNLLALNATIEAARAGDAGKGFAVVASEVKQLAGETANATSGISRQISAIQAAVAQAVGSVRVVCETIDQVSTISTTIAAAVEQQGAATLEISGQVQRVARQTQEASANFVEVAALAERNNGLGDQLLSAAGKVADSSETLRNEIDLFLLSMRDETGERRRYERVPCGDIEAVLVIGETGVRQPARLRDICFSGAGLGAASGHPEIGDTVMITLPDVATALAGRVARLGETPGEIGIVFRQDAQTREAVRSVLARFTPPADGDAVPLAA